MKTLFPLTLLLALAQSLPATEQTTAVIRIGNKPVLEYRYRDVPFKPYVAQLYSPNGVAVLRDNVLDHLHHHGLMFALAAGGVDFWAETPKCGRQVGRKFEVRDTGVTQQLDWTTSDGKVLLNEERSVQVHSGPVTLLTWRIRLQAKDEIQLTGSHYFGLGMRFLASMDKVGTFINSANATGDVVRGTERLAAANWCAYTAQGVTVALFDHPDNLRHPARMFTMNAPFAYQSATLNLWKEPFLLKKPLDLRYGVAVWDGQPGHDEIEKLYQHWLTR